MQYHILYHTRASYGMVIFRNPFLYKHHESEIRCQQKQQINWGKSKKQIQHKIWCIRHFLQLKGFSGGQVSGSWELNRIE